MENLQQLDHVVALNLSLSVPEVTTPTGTPYVSITAGSRTTMAATPLERLPLYLRHTNRFPYDRHRRIGDDVKNRLRSFGETDARPLLFADSESIAAIARIARQASEIRFQTREVHELLSASLRFGKEEADSGDGMDIRTLYLPPGGAAFLRFSTEWSRMRLLNRLGAYKFMASVDSKLLAQSSLILAIVGSIGAGGSIDAGKLMCRAWVMLNELGLAVHPYYVVADQMSRLRDGTLPNDLLDQAHLCQREAEPLFQLNKGETLYMLLRIGYPIREAPRSRRLPTASVFHNLTSGASAA